jgi:predicted methyltransferase
MKFRALNNATSVALVVGLTAVACAKQPEVLPAPAPMSGVQVGTAPITVESTAHPPKNADDLAGLPEPIRNALTAADRSADDRALDAGRKTGKLLEFFGVQPGMRVADLGAGLGYTTEILARVVGPTGSVYAQNPKFVLEKFAEGPWSQRLQRPALKNVVRVDREFDEPLPPEAKDLDVVINILFYHDTVWLKADREKMNRTIFAALKPRGVYGIVDHSAKAGAGVNDVQTLHRIEESVVIEEIQKAGFKLEASADFLRAPSDKRDWNASPRAAGEKRGQSDRFVLRFVKPG